MKAIIENNELVIRIPIETPRPSASGKTLTVATTNGFKPTDAKVNDQIVSVSINAFIKPSKANRDRF